MGIRKKVSLSFFKNNFRNRILYPFGRYDWNDFNSDRDHVVVTSKPNTDLLTNFPQVPENGGSHAIKLGSSDVFSDADKMKRTFTVTDCNSNIRLNYMFILNDGGHKQINQAVFFVRVFKGRGNGILDNIMNPIVKFSDDYDPNLQSINGVAYRYWDCFNIDLSKLVGETVTIEIVASDCAEGGHFGYAYIDFCVDNTPEADFTINQNFCNLEAPIIANGSNSSNITSWVWTVQPCDINGNGTGKEVISNWRYGKGAESEMSLNDMIRNTGESCGNFRIKLGGGNDCSSWVEVVKLISISCPQKGAAGADKCCTNGVCNIQIGKPNVSGSTYLWQPNNCLSSSSVSNPYFNSSNCNLTFTYPVRYVLQITDQFGCTGYDTMYIYSQPPTITSITVDSSQNLCDLFLTVSGSNYTSTKWQWMQPQPAINLTANGETILFPRYNTGRVVTATLTNACGATSNQISLNARKTYQSLTGLRLIFPNALNMNSPVPENRLLRIYEYGVNTGVANSYFGATDAKLEVLINWGQVIEVWKYSNQHFNNGQLTWDGYLNWDTNPHSDALFQGEWDWRISFKNCNNRSWVDKFDIYTDYVCTEYIWRWKGLRRGWRKECYRGSKEFESRDVNTITILK